jgi:hypothetical protein
MIYLIVIPLALLYGTLAGIWWYYLELAFPPKNDYFGFGESF